MAKKDKKDTKVTEEVIEEVVEEKAEVVEKAPEEEVKVVRIQMAITGIKVQQGILTSKSRDEGDRVLTDYK